MINVIKIAIPKWTLFEENQRNNQELKLFLLVKLMENMKDSKSIQGCHLSSTSKFPDFSLTFYNFPYPLTDLNNPFSFFCFIGLTVSLQIWGLSLQERICSPREQILSFKDSPPPPTHTPNEEGDGLRLSHEIVSSFPLLKIINNFSEDCLP